MVTVMPATPTVATPIGVVSATGVPGHQRTVTVSTVGSMLQQNRTATLGQPTQQGGVTTVQLQTPIQQIQKGIYQTANTTVRPRNPPK